MIPSFSIRSLTFNPGLVLAPMSGVTNSAFRRLIKELNPNAVGLMVTEFLSVEAMTRKSQRTMDMMKYREMERPLGIQIFGYDIERMVHAAKMVEDSGADLLDINCGCPAPKVVRKGGGCELMRQPDHLKSIFKAVRAAVKIPVTMKMRSGWDEYSKNCLDIAKMAEGEGLEAVTIHGRTRAQLYRGKADWEILKEVVSAVKIPVCGSGDIVDRETALERLSSGVSGLYIGRGAIENPLVFSEILSGEKHTIRRDGALAIRILERYIRLLREDCPEKAVLGKVKQLASQMARGHLWRKSILQSMSIQTVEEILLRAADTNSNLRLSPEGFLHAEG